MTTAMTPDSVNYYWRPGCPFCTMLRRGLDKAGIQTVDHNIWEDPEAAATVRDGVLERIAAAWDLPEDRVEQLDGGRGVFLVRDGVEFSATLFGDVLGVTGSTGCFSAADARAAGLQPTC